MFTNRYEQWMNQPDDKKTGANFKDWWAKKINLQMKTARTASKLGCSSNATTINDEQHMSVICA